MPASPDFNFGGMVSARDLEAAQEQMAQAQRSATNDQLALAQLQVTYDALGEDFAKIKAESEALKAKNEQLTTEIDHHNSAMETSEARLQELLDDNDKLKSSNDNLNTEINHLSDQLVNATAEKRELEKRADQLEKDLGEEQKRVRSQEADIQKYDDDLANLRREQADLKELIDKLKNEIENEQKANETLDGQLSNAYADLRKKEAEYKKLLHDKDDADAQMMKAQIDLHGAYEELNEARRAIEELESYKTSLEELEHDFDSAQTDLDSMRNDLADRDRAMHVKDARIQHLESQVQKALEAKLTAEDAFSAQPTEAPPVIPASGDSLEAELDAASENLDDLSDYGEIDEYDRCAISDVTTVADITPAVVVPMLGRSSIQTTSVAPVAPQMPTASTQTVSFEHKAVAVQTDTVQPEFGFACTTTADIAPVEPTTTIAPEKAPEPTIVHVVAPPAKKDRKTGWLLALLAIVLFYVLAQVQAHNIAYSYGGRGRYSTGAFGNGRYILGIFPVGFDIGPDWFSEQVCRTTSTAIATFESWAGITPTPLY